jgi:hypothetical protein
MVNMSAMCHSRWQAMIGPRVMSHSHFWMHHVSKVPTRPPYHTLEVKGAQ